MRIAGALLFGCLGIVTARAEWLYQSTDDAFTGPIHVAMAVEPDSGYFVAFKCTTFTDLTLLFATPIRLEQGDAKFLAHAPPATILVIVDDEPRQRFPATPEMVIETEQLRFVFAGPGVRQLAGAAAAAKRRFAVAVEINGKIMHSKTFEAAGSGDALKQMSSGCKLD